jgi:hypothetical protein
MALPNTRWAAQPAIQFRKISVTRKIALLQMPPDPQPAIGGLQRKMNMLGSFQLQNG